MSENIQPPLTFGVELEFIVKSLPIKYNLFNETPKDPEPEDPRPVTWPVGEDNIYENSYDVHKELSTVLRHHGIPCSDDGLLANVHSTWEVKSDASVRIDDEHRNYNYDHSSVEITTPVYYASNLANMGLNEIRRVISIIRNNFRVHVPATAGLHVHVGNGESGFTLQHMQNLQAILYVFDKQIQVLHPNRQYDANDEHKKYVFDHYFRAPSRCNLAFYLAGDYSMDIREEFDTKEDLSDQIVRAVGGGIYLDEKTEYSQAKRFLEGERRTSKIATEHVRVRQLFASGPESMSGIGATNIPDDKPGAIAQRLFRGQPIGIPPAKLDPALDVGPQMYEHITKHLKQDLDPEIKNLLVSPSGSTNTNKKVHPDPTTLLAPVKLLQAPDMTSLDFRSGTGQRVAAYNIHQLGVAEKYNSTLGRRTIEFRQHQGTLDAERVIPWVQMVVGMVQWTRDAPTTRIVELLRVGAERSPEEFDVVDLLRFMGLEGPAGYYEREFFEES